MSWKWFFNFRPAAPVDAPKVERPALKTARGTKFPIINETEHYVICREPENSKDTPREAVLDLEDLYGRGFRLSGVYSWPGGWVVFEKMKIKPALPTRADVVKTIPAEEFGKRFGPIAEQAKTRCADCAADIPRGRGVDDEGAEWWHRLPDGGARHCAASDFLEGRTP